MSRKLNIGTEIAIMCIKQVLQQIKDIKFSSVVKILCFMQYIRYLNFDLMIIKRLLICKSMAIKNERI